MPPCAVPRPTDPTAVRGSTVTPIGPTSEGWAAPHWMSSGTSIWTKWYSIQNNEEMHYLKRIPFNKFDTWIILCAHLWVTLLSDDPELDWCQTGWWPVWEGQCKCHRQSPQHLSALRRRCRNEELCGGERKCVDPHELFSLIFVFFLDTWPVCVPWLDPAKYVFL